MSRARLVAGMGKYQITLYLLAIIAGGLLGSLIPAVADPLEKSINTVLGLLLFATFLGIPFEKFTRALRDGRFMTTVMVLNFLIVPVIVFALSRFIARDQALLVGVSMVLLTPCIDYVIVFSGLAGGSSDRLLAAAPFLMLTQMLLLPLYLPLFAGHDFVAAIEPEPFIAALVFLIITPLLAAALTQWLANRWATARRLMSLVEGLMVPLMMLTLTTVIGSQIVAVGHELGSLLAVVPIYIAFLVIMVPVGMLAARAARLDAGATTAVVFSGATRNSLVVLPLALALPEPLALVALVIVTQTLIELIGMIAYVKLLPRLLQASHIIHV